ncbi:hypothetical protein CCACVL1_09988 [Corchorus capsularis]|uniref:Uncharacterized protein n=1 Tax=Corchorus capsularis TaxID=210143 RepID=A0A1R3ITB8_COCAP|nr:hypothetical protein CCACVL1_09988 [Corchorus capsularis]
MGSKVQTVEEPVQQPPQAKCWSRKESHSTALEMEESDDVDGDCAMASASAVMHMS